MRLVIPERPTIGMAIIARVIAMLCSLVLMGLCFGVILSLLNEPTFEIWSIFAVAAAAIFFGPLYFPLSVALGIALYFVMGLLLTKKEVSSERYRPSHWLAGGAFLGAVVVSSMVVNGPTDLKEWQLMVFGIYAPAILSGLLGTVVWRWTILLSSNWGYR